jgi:DnaJ-class molecular chaperone
MKINMFDPDDFVALYRGHQIIHFKVQIPTKLTDRQKQLLEDFDKDVKQEEDANGSGAHTKKNQQAQSKTSAWERLKSFLGANNKEGTDGGK